MTVIKLSNKMKTINYNQVARTLRRLFVQNPSRVSCSVFKVALKPVLNAAESTRLYNYYMDEERILEPINQKFAKWVRIHQDHFSEDAIRDIFLKYDIKSHFGKKKSLESTKECQLPEESFTGCIGNLFNEAALQCELNPLEDISVEELVKELLSRENISKVLIEYA